MRSVTWSVTSSEHTDSIYIRHRDHLNVEPFLCLFILLRGTMFSCVFLMTEHKHPTLRRRNKKKTTRKTKTPQKCQFFFRRSEEPYFGLLLIETVY